MIKANLNYRLGCLLRLTPSTLVFFLWNFFVSSHLTTARLLRFSCRELPQKKSFCVISSLTLTSQPQGCYGSAALNFHKKQVLWKLFVIVQFSTVRFAQFLRLELMQISFYHFYHFLFRQFVIVSEKNGKICYNNIYYDKSHCTF